MNQNIKIVRSNNSWIESVAIDQLQQVSQLNGILSTVGMPDLHPSKTPNGAAYLTQDIIYPHIIGNDIGCGIALFKTALKAHKFNVEKIKKQINRYEKLSDIVINFNPKDYNFPIHNKLGTIGSGNHFSEFQTIDKIQNHELFNTLNLSKKEVYLLVHSGSRNYGDYIIETLFNRSISTTGISKESPKFIDYLNAHDDALRFAHLNRQLIAKRILSVVQKHQPELLFESVHNSITKEFHNNQYSYVHRKGAAPSNVGPVVIAGTRKTPSYIVLPDPKIQDYLFSISHGAGRKWHRSGCKDRLLGRYDKKTVKQAASPSLVCHNKALFYEESPDAYKNINQVIEDLVNHKMVKIIATLKPCLTVKI